MFGVNVLEIATQSLQYSLLYNYSCWSVLDSLNYIMNDKGKLDVNLSYLFL